MRDVMIVKDLDAIKTLSDPLRVRILDILIDHSATSKQVSTDLGLSSANVHYHIKELEKQGLIQLVETVEKGGILEKYYRAVASNYYVDHFLGQHDPESASVVEAFNREIMRRRRQEQLQVDLDRFCDRVVRDCLSIRPGETVIISGGFHQQEILEYMNDAVIRAKARPVALVMSDRMWLSDYQSLNSQSEPITSEPLYKWLKDVQAGIYFDELVDPSIFTSLSTETIDQVAQRNHVYWTHADELRIRRLTIAYPTRKRAEIQGIEYSTLFDTYWRGLDVDYTELQNTGRRLGKRISEASEVRITGPYTDLRFSLAGRRPQVDDGTVSESDLKYGQFHSDLPAGEVRVAPMEGSAEGKAFFHSATYRGQVLRNIMMEFRRGELVSVSAEQDSDAAQVRELLFLPVEDDRRKLGIFSIGFNPALISPLGYSVIDHKVHGAVRIAVGGNDNLGGTNTSAITWSFLLLGCRVELDGQVILEQGVFSIG